MADPELVGPESDNMSVIVGWHIVRFCKFPLVTKFRYWIFGLGCVHFDNYIIGSVSTELRSTYLLFMFLRDFSHLSRQLVHVVVVVVVVVVPSGPVSAAGDGSRR